MGDSLYFQVAAVVEPDGDGYHAYYAPTTQVPLLRLAFACSGNICTTLAEKHRRA